MKYYLIEITTYVDGTKDSYGIYSYDNKADAIANFHSKMGAAMKNANYASELIYVIGGEGEKIEVNYFKRPVVDPTPEPEVAEPTEEA